MNIKEQFTTVTLLSKCVALALFIILPIGGFMMGVEYAGNTVVTAPELLGDDGSTKVKTYQDGSVITKDSKGPDLEKKIIDKEDPQKVIVGCCHIEEIYGLIEKDGNIDLIVQLDIDFTPEGYLTEGEIEIQETLLTQVKKEIITQMENNGEIITLELWEGLPMIHVRIDKNAFDTLVYLPSVKQVDQNDTSEAVGSGF